MLGCENIWERVTGDLHSEKQLAGDLAAFSNTMLSAAAVSRLPWGRRDGTISLSRLASNITLPNFLYYKTLLFGHQVFLYPGKNSLFSRNVNVAYIFVCA